jgi:retron-type reverse transcriptase
MQNAHTYLGLIRERGKAGLPLERVYRQLFNRELYLMAYGKIYRNKGAMTSGSTDETADGMSLDKIDTLIEALQYERYRWTPVRRVYIEKKHSTKQRALGLPTWSDKLVQEVIRLILDAYYEPQFSRWSHGFRPEKGCHTALRDIYQTWAGTIWYIEGDISACFDSLDHAILLSILAEKIHDTRFLRLMGELLDAGYLEDWKYHLTLSGSPQGGISLKRQIDAVLPDRPNRIWNKVTELEKRLLADTCELCGSQENVEVHHIRALKDLKQYGRPEKPAWVKQMAAMNRKTLVLCRKCHQDVQYGRPRRQRHVHEHS